MGSTTALDLVRRSGIDVTADHVAQADRYLTRARRSRWVGLACGLLVGFGPLAGEGGEPLVVPRLLVGYLVGVMLTDLLTPRASRGGVRSASLRPRSVSDLVPRAAIVLPWLTLAPVVAVPLLALGSHPRGVTRFSSATGNGFCRAYWPQTTTLFVVAGLAAASLLAMTLTLRRLAQRSQPAEDPATLRLDRVLRARSARAALAAATALGLTLVSIIGELVYQGIHSYDCSRPMTDNNIGNVYSWAGAVNGWLPAVSLLLLFLALLAWVVCQRLPMPARAFADT